MDRDELAAKAGAVSGIYSAIAVIVVIVGLIAIVVGFVQALADTDDTLVGVLAGLLVALAILVYVIVAWAGVQLFSIVAAYIHEQTRGDYN